MPNKATVRGILMDATLAPIAKGKIIATLNVSVCDELTGDYHTNDD